LAIFHLKSAHDRVSRSAGQTSVASAAYIMPAKFTDERTGQGYDIPALQRSAGMGGHVFAERCAGVDARRGERREILERA